MTVQSILNPLPFFVGLDGTPLSSGYVYIGVPNHDPRQYPVQVYYDQDFQVPASQPLRTNAGYLYRNGTQTGIWVDGGSHSLLVLDAQQRQVAYVPVFLGTLPAVIQATTTVDRFSGTGAQTSFTLSVPPGSENDTEVFVSGVYQQKDTYSVSGTTLTFAVAPAAGVNNIEVNAHVLLDYASVSSDVSGWAAEASASAASAGASASQSQASANNAHTSELLAAASAASAAAVSGAYVGLTRSAIKALNTATVQQAYCNESGREGAFKWDPTDRSSFFEVQNFTPTLVTTARLTYYGHQLDTGAGIYVKTAAYGLTPYVLYYTGYVDNDEFQVADSFANAKAGIFRTLTVTAHTAIYRHADPHEGRFLIPPGLRCDCSQGAWVRDLPGQGVYNLAWWGLDTAFAHNQAIVTSALHACEDGATLLGPKGTFPVSRYTQMRWRLGQTLKGERWQFRLEGPNSTTFGSIIRAMKHGSRVIGVAGGKFHGQVPGDLTTTDGNLCESAGVHVFPDPDAGDNSVDDVEVAECFFYDLDTGVTASMNHRGDGAGFVLGKFQYYPSRRTRIHDNYMNNIRRQGVEVIGERTMVYNNIIFMGDKLEFVSSRGVRVVGGHHTQIFGNRFYGYDETVAGTRGIGLETLSMSLGQDPVAIRQCRTALIYGNYLQNFSEAFNVNGALGTVEIYGNVAVGNPNPPPPSSTVTISNASPGVVTWGGNLLPNGTRVTFTTTGALPSPLAAGTDYYVVNQTTNNFQVALTVGGAAINTTTAGSGTHTCTAPDLKAASRATTWFLRLNTLGYGQFAATPNVFTVTTPLASPGVVTWTGHRLVLNDRVKFYTDGTLPTEIVSGTYYYAVNLTTDTFQLATTPSGTPINFTGATSGTHTIVPERLFNQAKLRVDRLRLHGNRAFSICYFFDGSGWTIWQEIKNNVHIGNGNNVSRFVQISNISNDTPQLERTEFTNIEDNLSIMNQLASGGSVNISNTHAGEYYSVNRNKMSGGSGGVLVAESGSALGTISIDNSYSNELLPSGTWASFFNPPLGFDTDLDLGSLA